jgi:uncharacterized protein YutE (UPF0331/DUF86 family)
VNEGRAALLAATIQQRSLDAQRHLAALEAAAAEFGEDFGFDLFDAAWRSNEPVELHKAYAVQAGYENVINACITIAQELCELEGWSPAGRAPSSIEALRLLHENGVMSAASRTALKEAQERRTDVQHDYANVAPRDIHSATASVLEHGPLLLQEVAAQLRQRG